MSEFDERIRQYQAGVIEIVEGVLDRSIYTEGTHLYGPRRGCHELRDRRIEPGIWTDEMQALVERHKEADSLEERAREYEGNVADSFRNLAEEMRQGIPELGYLNNTQNLDKRVGSLGYIVLEAATDLMHIQGYQNAIPERAIERNRHEATARIMEICQEQWNEGNVAELRERLHEISTSYLYSCHKITVPREPIRRQYYK